MKEIVIAIVLGIVQGLTEFLPVSSSGHLELTKFILGDHSVGEESMLMTTTLHLGTALATLLVFRKQIMSIIYDLFNKSNATARNFAFKIIISMVPAVFIGLFFEEAIEALFNSNIFVVCLLLILTGVLLFFSAKAKTTDRDVTFSDAILIGISQAIAILPGLSRSGATISTATLLGVDKTKAAEFSFLMVVPLIFGKVAKDFLDGALTERMDNTWALFFGFLASLIVGIFACQLMIKIVKSSKLSYFSYYCFIVGVIGVIYWLINR
jgi:undecaprenyl-diphosphatase